MLNFNQKGIASFFLLILLALGIGFGVYLVQQRTNLTPHASSGGSIEFVNDQDQPITATSSATVRIKLTPPLPLMATNTASPSASIQSSPSVPTRTSSSARTATSPSPPPATQSISCKKDSECPAGYYCLATVNTPGCRGFFCPKKSVNTCVPKSPASPAPVYAVGAVLAEDPNFASNVQNIQLTTNPQYLNYTFLGSTYGTKTLYVKYLLSNSTEQSGQPYPATIQVTAPSPSPSPIPSCNPNTEVCFDRQEANVIVEEGHGFQGPNYWSSSAFNLVGQGARGFNLFSDSTNIIGVNPSGGAFANGTTLQVRAQIPSGSPYGNYTRVIKLSVPDSQGQYRETPFTLNLNVTYRASTSPIAWGVPDKIVLTKKINDFSNYPTFQFNSTSGGIFRVEPTPIGTSNKDFYAIFTSSFSNRAVYTLGTPLTVQIGLATSNLPAGVYTGNFIFYADNQSGKEVLRVPYEITLTN